ncbi:DUF3307 domain-containing protein [Pelodictyon phaeoclathratiforme]|uniref:DUF3307 domain-containing protein n=1 Tax=Pelodictyon phaeoclathratiforme (strain DSM 5477 / BU-1) TaxID=324925 RepID=B4SCL3_PELPB|nr:DUF3307 domain-containing protein [Pelodictyon phaeoclathratiforme]ACF44218.1 conserved hypothetical protein, membrane [Pelodictyon phaeoclathratiforme BU-1]MBV5288584.1 DUF3307 domain-containing protein [Pelodictyon phaeoclathratiforme]
MEKIAAILIAAHFIGDYFLQPDKMVRNKRLPLMLILHGAIHAGTTWLLLQLWHNWQAPLAVFLLHTIIDLIKQRLGKANTATFITDQTAHLFSLLMLAMLLSQGANGATFTGFGYQLMIGFAGFIATVRGAGFLVTFITRELTIKNNLRFEGLQNGETLIGQLERGLIFLFFLAGHPESIGFLLAAKSILRFEESKKAKQGEYILIGTLLSFSAAIALSSATLWAMRL